MNESASSSSQTQPQAAPTTALKPKNYNPIILIFAVLAIVIGGGLAGYAVWRGNTPQDINVAGSFCVPISNSQPLDDLYCPNVCYLAETVTPNICSDPDNFISIRCAFTDAVGCNNTPTPPTNPQPPAQTCNPGQWFACGYGRCNSGQSAQCNSSGTDYNCFDDPATCNPPQSGGGGGGNATTTSRRTTTTGNANNTSSGATTSIGGAGGGGGNVGGVNNGPLPATGILDENPAILVGAILVILGGLIAIAGKRASADE